jgi:hypothetical protein
MTTSFSKENFFSTLPVRPLVILVMRLIPFYSSILLAKLNTTDDLSNARQNVEFRWYGYSFGLYEINAHNYIRALAVLKLNETLYNAVKKQNVPGGVPSIFTELSYEVDIDPLSYYFCSARITVGTNRLTITPRTVTIARTRAIRTPNF